MHATTPDRSSRRWWALALLSLAQFLVILDTSIIGIALPEIRDALGFSDTSLQWVFNAYVIAFGGLLLLGGRLSDLVGARRIFVAGFAVLGGGSLLAGLAWSSDALIVGRAFQGVGAALIAPAAMALVMTLFTTPSELGKAMSIWGAAAPAGGTAGVFLGGVITQWISWRWTFLINVPVAAVVLASVPALLPRGISRRGRIDVAGAATVTGGLAALVYATVTANDTGWLTGRTIGLYTLAILALAAFVLIEARRREPLVRLGIFRTSNLAGSNVVMALLGAAWIPMWFFLNLYIQSVRGYDAFEAGLALLPMTVTIMFLMVGVTGRLVAKVGFRTPMVTGLLLLAAGIGLLARVPAEGSFAVDVLPASLLAALGMSLSYIPVLFAALSGADPAEAGLASGLVNTTYQVGSALGLAATTAISTSVAAASVRDGASTLVASIDGFHAALAGAVIAAIVAAGVAMKTVRNPTAAVEEAEAPPVVGTV